MKDDATTSDTIKNISFSIILNHLKDGTETSDMIKFINDMWGNPCAAVEKNE
jgi:hypothetical protein